VPLDLFIIHNLDPCWKSGDVLALAIGFLTFHKLRKFPSRSNDLLLLDAMPTTHGPEHSKTIFRHTPSEGQGVVLSVFQTRMALRLMYQSEIEDQNQQDGGHPETQDVFAHLLNHLNHLREHSNGFKNLVDEGKS
jgi:hypothetical protein